MLQICPGCCNGPKYYHKQLSIYLYIFRLIGLAFISSSQLRVIYQTVFNVMCHHLYLIINMFMYCINQSKRVSLSDQ